MEAKIAHNVKGSSELPEQLEVIDGKLVMIGTSETPTFPDIPNGCVSLVYRDGLVMLMDLKDQYMQILLLLNSLNPELFSHLPAPPKQEG